MHISINFCIQCLTNVCKIHTSSTWLGVWNAMKPAHKIKRNTKVKQLTCTECHKAFISLSVLENISFIMKKGHLLAPCVTNYSKLKWLEKNQGFIQEKSLLPASNVTNHLKTEVLQQPLHFLQKMTQSQCILANFTCEWLFLPFLIMSTCFHEDP